MTIGIWILGDQLWAKSPLLSRFPDAPILMIEAASFAHQRRYHAQKLVLVWSAMRHFAAELKAQGRHVEYPIAPDIPTALNRWRDRAQITEIYLTEPRDRPFRQWLEQQDFFSMIRFAPDSQFLWARSDFQAWATGRKRLLMEDFYRESRKRFSILMAADQPVGSKWNFDTQNRKPPKKNESLNSPRPLTFAPDQMTQAVIAHIQQSNLPTYGEIEPFQWGVTRQDAIAALDYFIHERLPGFGPYQDAMVTGEETLWHALLSPYLNLGLLHPKEVIAAAETAYQEQNLPLNSVEGFIRQVLGWREYLHGLYHYFPADYALSNWFNYEQPLPAFFWDSAQTEMNCLRQVLSQVERTGYSHHIQRLMILSNFALIAGINPQALKAWFHSAYVDAYDWVMVTNVLGMGVFADGGKLASKPYAASANYVNKMSDYCRNCRYNPRDRVGAKACPFNFFYWDFLLRHEEKLRTLGRMSLVLSHLKKMDQNERDAIAQHTQQWWQNTVRAC